MFYNKNMGSKLLESPPPPPLPYTYTKQITMAVKNKIINITLSTCKSFYVFMFSDVWHVSVNEYLGEEM